MNQQDDAREDIRVGFRGDSGPYDHFKGLAAVGADPLLSVAL